MKLVIPGGAGFCGQGLVRRLAPDGHELIVLSRRPVALPGATVLPWDGVTLGPWADAIDGADAVINLAGRSVNCRYVPDNCTQIYASRLDSTRIVGAAIAASKSPPRVWLNASSATIYRHAQDRPMDEATGELGKGFSVDVCRQWERTLAEARTPGTRKVALRSAMVLDHGPGGVWEAFSRLARRGLAGPMAGGRQFVSFLHGDDFARALLFLLERDDLCGPVNVAAPHPLPNADFLRVLRRAVGARLGLPSAPWMLEVGAFFLQTETELLVKSRRVVPGKLLAAGFLFRYPTWPEAAAALAPESLP